MASGWTNRGATRIFEMGWGNATEPTNFFFALADQTTTPTADTTTFGQLTEIPAGNGYTSGGIQRARNGTNFPVTEDAANDRAFIDIPDLVWTASGGPLPASGDGARWMVVTDDNGTIGSREVYAYWDLVSNRTVSSGQSLTIQDAILRGQN